MKNKILIFSIVGVIVVSVMGCLSHFAYKWFGSHPVTAFAFAIDESVFQHIKIFIMPYLFYGVSEYFIYGKHLEKFLPIKTLSLLLGAGIIPTVYYLYKGILGFSVVWFDISIYFMAVLISFYFYYKKMNQSDTCSFLENGIWFIVLLIVIGATVIFSYYKPNLGLFIPPQ